MISAYTQAEIEQDQAQSRQRDGQGEEFQRQPTSCEEERAEELPDTKSVLGWEHQWLHSPFAMKADTSFFKNSALFDVESPLSRFKPSWSAGSMLAMDKTPTQTVQNLT